MYQPESRDQSAIMASIIAARDSKTSLVKDSVLETDSVSKATEHHKFGKCYILKSSLKKASFLKVEHKTSMDQVEDFHRDNFNQTGPGSKQHPHLVNQVDYAVFHHKKLCFDQWIIAQYFELPATDLKSLLLKKQQSSVKYLKTFELRMMLKQLSSALSFLHRKFEFHARLQPLEIGFTSDGQSKLWAIDLVKTEKEYKTVQKNLMINKKRVYQSPSVFNALKKNSLKFELDMAKEDSFALGLILLEAGTGIDSQGVYHRKKKLDEGELAYMLNEFERNHNSDPQLVQNVKQLCETDADVRLHVGELRWSDSPTRSGNFQPNMANSHMLDNSTQKGRSFNNQSGSQNAYQMLDFETFRTPALKPFGKPMDQPSLKRNNTETRLSKQGNVFTPTFSMKKSKTNKNLPTYYKKNHQQTNSRFGYDSKSNSGTGSYTSKSVPRKRQIQRDQDFFANTPPINPLNIFSNYPTSQTTNFSSSTDQKNSQKKFNNSNQMIIETNRHKEYNGNGQTEFLRTKKQVPKQNMIITKQNSARNSPNTKQHAWKQQTNHFDANNGTKFTNFGDIDPNFRKERDLSPRGNLQTRENHLIHPENSKKKISKVRNPHSKWQQMNEINRNKNFGKRVSSNMKNNEPFNAKTSIFEEKLEDSEGNQYNIDAGEFFEKHLNPGQNYQSGINSKFNLLSNNFDERIPSAFDPASRNNSHLMENMNYTTNPRDFDEKFQINTDELFSQRMFNSNDGKNNDIDFENPNSIFFNNQANQFSNQKNYKIGDGKNIG